MEDKYVEVKEKELEEFVNLTARTALLLLECRREIDRLHSKLNFWRVGACVNLALAMSIFLMKV